MKQYEQHNMAAPKSKRRFIGYILQFLSTRVANLDLACKTKEDMSRLTNLETMSMDWNDPKITSSDNVT